MDFLDSNKTKIVVGIHVIVVAVIIFIGAMVGTSLRKLSTEEGNLIKTLQSQLPQHCFVFSLALLKHGFHKQ